MKRPILIATLGYTIGIIGGLYLSMGVVLFGIIFTIVFLFIIKKLKRQSWKVLFLFCFFVILGSMIITYKNKQYQTSYQEETLQIEGIIISNGQEKSYSDVYTIKVLRVNQDTSFYHKNLQVIVKKGKAGTTKIEYGDKVVLKGNYEKPLTRRNYKGFNQSYYLYSKGIYGTVLVDGNIKVIKKDQVCFILRFVNRLKEKLKQNMIKLVKEEQIGLALSLLLGDKTLLEKNVKEDFTDSSLSHLLAVSGAHTSYLILGITLFASKLRIHKNIVQVICALVLFLFMVLVGFTPSVTRAGIMGIVSLLASTFHRKTDTITTLSLSLFLLLLFHPFAITDIGLRLSFAGTIGILLFYQRMTSYRQKITNTKNKVVEKIEQMLIVTFSAQLMVFPIVWYTFGTFSFTFFLSNLFAGPLLGFVMILGLLTGVSSVIFYPIANIFSFPFNIGLKLLKLVATVCSYLPFSKVYFPIPDLFFFILYYFFLFILFYRQTAKFRTKIQKQVRIHKTIIICLISILIIMSGIFSQLPNDLKIHFIDVGQGDSCLVITPYGKRILIDGGGSEKEKEFNVGESILLPYLLHQKTGSLDMVLISHTDADHVSGLLTLMQKIRVKNVVIGKQFETSENYEKLKKVVKEKKIKVQVVEAGQRIKIEKDLYFDVLWPSSDNVIGENGINNNSLVGKMVYQDFSMLFTGDIEEVAEKAILQKYKNTNRLKSTVLKVAHHGSKSSSIPEFLNVVKPQIALIGVGKKNTFGHPNAGVLERIKERRL